MKADVELIVIAGSETTQESLTILFYNLVCHSHVYRKLQQQVDGLMEQQGIFKPQAVENSGLAKLEYL